MTSWGASARIALHERTCGARSVEWMRVLLREISDKSHVLIIGAGTCHGLVAHMRTISVRQLTIVAQECDMAYVLHAREALGKAGLSSRVTVLHGELHDLQPPNGRLFDHVICAAGFGRIIGDTNAQSSALKRAVELLVDREAGRILFAERLLPTRSFFSEVLAPAFAAAGDERCLYEGDFDDALSAAGLVVARYDKLCWEGDVDGKEARFVIARSRIYVAATVEYVA